MSVGGLSITLYELELLSELGEWYIGRVRDAIEHKPIKRKSISKPDGFEATVDATGKLKSSLRKELKNGQELEVWCLAYIDKLIFGQPPGEKVEVSEIETWLAAKGLDYNSTTVARNIRAVGSSIWNQFHGANSGLLSDINVEAKVNEVKQKLLLKTVEEIKQEFATAFKEAA